MMSRHTAGWSSQVARRAHNPKVVGSNPTPATKKEWPEASAFRSYRIFSGLYPNVLALDLSNGCQTLIGLRQLTGHRRVLSHLGRDLRSSTRAMVAARP